MARFIVAMGMARNDVTHALRHAGQANDQDDPEFTYWVRIASGHFFEAAYALQHWRQVEAVRAFIARLPDDALEQLRCATSATQRLGQGVLEHSRDRTFHYPYPTSRYPTDQELTACLEALGFEEVTLVVESPGRFRFQFADHVALALALGKHDEQTLRQQQEIARDGAVGFVNFVTRAWESYVASRGLSLEPPQRPARE